MGAWGRSRKRGGRPVRPQTEYNTGKGSDCVDAGTRERAPSIYLRFPLTFPWTGVDGGAGGEGGYRRRSSSHCRYPWIYVAS